MYFQTSPNLQSIASRIPQGIFSTLEDQSIWISSRSFFRHSFLSCFWIFSRILENVSCRISQKNPSTILPHILSWISTEKFLRWKNVCLKKNGLAFLLDFHPGFLLHSESNLTRKACKIILMDPKGIPLSIRGGIS